MTKLPTAQANHGARKQLRDRRNPGENLSSVPLEIHPAKTRGLKISTDDKVKMAIRNYLSPDESVETFEEADDFEMEDDEPPLMSPYEMTQMEEDAEFSDPHAPDQIEAQKQEEKEEKSAPKEALEKGADENPQSS